MILIYKNSLDTSIFKLQVIINNFFKIFKMIEITYLLYFFNNRFNFLLVFLAYLHMIINN